MEATGSEGVIIDPFTEMPAGYSPPYQFLTPIDCPDALDAALGQLDDHLKVSVLRYQLPTGDMRLLDLKIFGHDGKYLYCCRLDEKWPQSPPPSMYRFNVSV